MRKYLFICLILLSYFRLYAQSLSFDELKGLTNLDSDQVNNYLILSKGFKLTSKQVHGGKNFEVFKSNRIDPKLTETVLLRANEVIRGELSRQVIYFTLNAQDINKLLVQARQSDMILVFQGADKHNNIYRFDNSLFMALIFIRFDKKSGSIQIEEK